MSDVEATGFDAAIRKLRRLSSKLKDIQTLHVLIKDEISSIAQDSINNQKSAAASIPFKELSPVTQRIKSKRPNQALQSRRISTAEIVDLTIAGKTTIISSKMPYAEIHMFGNDRIPKRPFLPVTQDGKLTEKFKARVEEIITDYFEEE